MKLQRLHSIKSKKKLHNDYERKKNEAKFMLECVCVCIKNKQFDDELELISLIIFVMYFFFYVVSISCV